jgi:hypothetical protein
VRRWRLILVVVTGCWTSPPPVAPSTPVAARASDAGVDAAPLATNDNTGFDLYVMTPGVTTWKLDGESIDTRLPARIRGIAPGPHQVEIDAPAGYANKTLQVDVELDKPSKIQIELDPVSN